MLRVLFLTLLAGASVAHAGERYREVWNPPEARHALQSPHKLRHKPAARQLSAKRSTKRKPSRVTACAPTPAKHGHTRRALRINAGSHSGELRFRPTPKSNVLRVDLNNARPQVVR